jgi:hypothetical protein
MLKGDLKKIYGVWHVVYSRENSGRIQEIELTDYSSRMLSEKKGDNIKYLQDVYFDITSDGMAAVKFFPDPPPTKIVREAEKPSFVSPELDKPFSTNEELIMKHLVSAYEEFLNLEQRRPNDTTDFLFHINALQRILGQRVLRRDYPNTFATYK